MAAAAKLRARALPVQARTTDTSLVQLGKCHIEHAVTINGGGTVVIGDGVSLGYRLATTTKTPILLQARGTNAHVAIVAGNPAANIGTVPAKG